MPWTVTITEPRRTGADVETTATYSDGAQTLTETYRFASLTQLKQTCINRIAQLTEAAASMASVRAGVQCGQPVQVDRRVYKGCSAVFARPSPQWRREHTLHFSGSYLFAVKI